MTMMLVRELGVAAAVICFAQIGVYYLYATTSCHLERDGTGEYSDLRALVVSDVHLLGKRRRSWIERAWVDWQVRQRKTFG